MPTTAQLIAFCAASLVIILVPGPSVMFIIGRALAYGRKTALLTVVGNNLGEFAAAAFVAVGLGTVIAESTLAFNLVKYAGAAYLVYLGVKAFRDRGRLLKTVDEGTPTGRSMFEGFLVGMLNPKSVLFFLAMLPQFVNPAGGSAAAQMLLLAAIYMVLGLACDTVTGLLASRVREWFESRRAKRILGGVGGTSMIGLGIAAAAGERA
ncbi:LysE family translocator [Glycomyces albus]